jgi:RsmE family RNA methyltransferase
LNLLLINEDHLTDDTATLTDPRQLKHIQQHLKLNVGDSIKIGVRDGFKGTATVASLCDTALILGNILLDQPPPPKLPMTLIIALPRPKVLRRLIMDAVTLGAERIILLHSYRVEKSYWQSPFLQQIDDYIQLGLEQAGDTGWPQVVLKQRFKPFVEDELPALCQDKIALVAHPYAQQVCPAQIEQPCVLVIGCEGGFIPYEIELLQKNGCQPVSLGARILRTETAVAHLIGRLF